MKDQANRGSVERALHGRDLGICGAESRCDPCSSQSVEALSPKYIAPYRPVQASRAMLDAYMFGRDRRELRDDAVRVAWQIDSLGRRHRPIVETRYGQGPRV